MTLEEYEALIAQIRNDLGTNVETTSVSMQPESGKKCKRSKYNRELSRQLKIVKQKHPRTKQKDLMAKAHKLTRKALGMKPKRKSRN